MTNEADRLAPAGSPPRGATPLVLRGNGTWCRVRTWPYRSDVAQLVLPSQPRLPSPGDLDRWGAFLLSLGYHRVRTGALGAVTGERVERSGYQPVQELVLLRHEQPGIAVAPTRPTFRLVTARRADAGAVDRAAFPAGWQLDADAITDVCTATPRYRARAAGDDPMLAYAITGRDSRQGFLQRLAVDPAHHREGIGMSLVNDSLRWLARWRVQHVLVNTPTDNLAALHLYERVGFEQLTDRLRVYERSLI